MALLLLVDVRVTPKTLSFKPRELRGHPPYFGVRFLQLLLVRRRQGCGLVSPLKQTRHLRHHDRLLAPELVRMNAVLGCQLTDRLFLAQHLLHDLRLEAGAVLYRLLTHSLILPPPSSRFRGPVSWDYSLRIDD